MRGYLISRFFATAENAKLSTNIGKNQKKTMGKKLGTRHRTSTLYLLHKASTVDKFWTPYLYKLVEFLSKFHLVDTCGLLTPLVHSPSHNQSRPCY